jgi:2-deoxy-D-gluconate 3-dehydrogenase
VSNESPDLTGRRALVLGAGSAAGRAIALALAQAGADVAVASSSLDGEEVMACRRTRRAVESLGRRSAEYAFDVTLGQNVQVSTRQVAKEMGGLEVLVYAVASPLRRPAEKLSDAEWARALAVNLSGAFFACRAAVREMTNAGWGRILLVAPPAGDDAGVTAGVARYALAGLARSLAAEFAERGIRVNLLAPDRLAGVETRALSPTGNDEIGAVAVYLAGEGGDSVSGEVVQATGTPAPQ